MKREKKTRQAAWGYRESFCIIGGLLLVGFLLQMFFGSFDFYILSAPANFYLGALIVLLSLWIGIKDRTSRFGLWFTGIPLSVSLLLTLLVLGLIMGLVRQYDFSRSVLGFDAMTSHWAFVLTYLWILLSLGSLVVRKMFWFKKQEIAFYIQHIGLWLFLTAAGLGHADLERYVVSVREGETEWRVYDPKGQTKELPIAIELKDFDMDVYPPKLAIIDLNIEKVQAAEKAQYFSIDQDIPKGSLCAWNLEVLEYIHQAVWKNDSTYQELPVPGACPAAKVKLFKDGLYKEAWISAGNKAQQAKSLELDRGHVLLMTTPEPRSFMSDIVVYTRKGETKSSLLEVNKPLRIGAWTIYQYGYDKAAGSLSTYSSFELVYDPWQIPIYTGIIFIMIGSLSLLWTGKKKKENSL